MVVYTSYAESIPYPNFEIFLIYIYVCVSLNLYLYIYIYIYES